MRETIQNYFEKTKQYPKQYSNEDFSTICDGIKKEIDKGVFLVKRKDETDLSVFEEKYGYNYYETKQGLIMASEQRTFSENRELANIIFF